MSLNTKVLTHLQNNDIQKAIEEYYEVFIHLVMQIVIENNDSKHYNICDKKYAHFYKFAHDMNTFINKYYERNCMTEFYRDTNNYFRDYLPAMLKSKNNITMDINITFEKCDPRVKRTPRTYWDISLDWQNL